MGRKKKKQTKPWCWYCNREFDDEKIAALANVTLAFVLQVKASLA